RQNREIRQSPPGRSHDKRTAALAMGQRDLSLDSDSAVRASPEGDEGMSNVGKHGKRIALAFGIFMMTMSNSGCFHMIGGFADVLYSYIVFWGCTPPIPVSAYWSQKI